MYFAPSAKLRPLGRMIVKPNRPFVQYGVPVPESPGGPAFQLSYLGRTVTGYASYGVTPMMELQQYLLQAVRQAYKQILPLNRRITRRRSS